MLLDLSWKNIWRNKVRSAVLVGAIAFGLAGTLFIIGLSQGFIDSRNIKIIETQLGHIQIHTPSFEEQKSVADTIVNLSQVYKVLDQIPEIKAYSSRLRLMSMALSTNSMAGVVINAIDPAVETKVTNLTKYLIDKSQWFESNKVDNSVIIGRTLAKNLQLVYYKITDKQLATLQEKGLSNSIVRALSALKDTIFRRPADFYNALELVLSQNQFNMYADFIGDACAQYRLGRRIILRIQDQHGQIIEEVFRVIGVFDTQNDIFDGSEVFVNKRFLTQILDLAPGATNEIAILLKNPDNINRVAQQLKRKLPGLKVETMFDLDPLLALSRTMLYIYYLILEIFILLTLSFGIVNTMLMAVLERTKEIGMLMAIGMNRRRVFSMIMLETVMVTLTGSFIGMLLGIVIVAITGHTGMDFSKYIAQGFRSAGYSPVIYPRLPLPVMFITTAIVILTAIIAAIYPALKAIKLKPAQALRTEA